MFYLQKGRAKLTVVSNTGKEATIALLASGEFVGEEAVGAILGNRMATAIAITACKMCIRDRLKGIRPADFAEPRVFYQIGMEPVRIDIMTSVPGLDFGSAWERRLIVDFDGEPAGVLSREDLLLSKKAAGRPRNHKHVGILQKPRKLK